MKYIIALKSSSLYNRLVHNVFLLAFGIALVYVCYANPWALIALIGYLFYLYRRRCKFINILLFLIIIYAFVIGISLMGKTKIDGETYDGTALIETVTVKKNYTTVILRINGEKVLWLTDEVNLKSGMKLHVTGYLIKPEVAHVPYGYDELTYLKYQNIHCKIRVTEYQILKKSFSIYQLNEYFNNYYELNFPERSASYLKALVIGNKNDLDQNDMDKIGLLGISHLFVVSGLHINLLIMIVQKLLERLKIPLKYHGWIVISFLSLYLLASGFLIAVVRVFTGEILKHITKRLKLSFDSLDILSINFLFVCMMLPMAPFQYGFILTYVTTFSITISRRIFDQFKNYFVQSMAISVIAFLITFPIIVSISHSINCLSIIFNLFYIPLVSFVLLPLSMIVSLLPILAPLYELLVTGFSNSLLIFSELDILSIQFPEPSLLIYGVYYGFLFLFLRQWERRKPLWKHVLLLSCFLFIYKGQRYLNPNDEVVFLDLKIGESTFIGQSFNRCNVLIDTGEMGNQDLFTFLDAFGISRIDYLVISHGDTDHSGQALEIIRKYSVHNLIYSAYDDSEKIKEIINYAQKIKIHPLKSGDRFVINDEISMEIISPIRKYSSTNDNSLVFTANIFGLRYLFTGDINQKVEQEIIRNRKMDVDIYKVAHHGSITSTSEVFLENLDYRLAVIMSGSRNMYGFPSKIVVKRLEGSNLYQTKERYSIILQRKFYEKRFKLKTVADNRIVIFSPLGGDT